MTKTTNNIFFILILIRYMNVDRVSIKFFFACESLISRYDCIGKENQKNILALVKLIGLVVKYLICLQKTHHFV